MVYIIKYKYLSGAYRVIPLPYNSEVSFAVSNLGDEFIYSVGGRRVKNMINPDAVERLQVFEFHGGGCALGYFLNGRLRFAQEDWEVRSILKGLSYKLDLIECLEGEVEKLLNA